MNSNIHFKQKPSKFFLHLCKSTAKAIKQYHMIEEKDRLLVGISGGEDSMMLMHVLQRLQQRAPIHFELIPALINMNFDGFNVNAVQTYCQQQKWNLQIVTLDGQEILEQHQAGNKPCPMCSRLRRGKLHGLADKLHCNKIALGHHLDDICVSFLLALFRGGGLKTMGVNVPADAQSKQLIRPFCFSTKETIHTVAETFDLPKIQSCPFETQLKEHGDRFYLENLLKSLNLKFPYIRSAMLHSLSDVRLVHLLDPRYLSESKDPDAGKL